MSSESEYEHRHTFSEINQNQDKTMEKQQYVVLTSAYGDGKQKVYLHPNIAPVGFKETEWKSSSEAEPIPVVNVCFNTGMMEIVTEKLEDILIQYENKRTNHPPDMRPVITFDDGIFGDIERQANNLHELAEKPKKVVLGSNKLDELLSFLGYNKEQFDHIHLEHVLLITRFGRLSLVPSDNSDELSVHS